MRVLQHIPGPGWGDAMPPKAQAEGAKLDLSSVSIVWVFGYDTQRLIPCEQVIRIHQLSWISLRSGLDITNRHK